MNRQLRSTQLAFPSRGLAPLIAVLLAPVLALGACSAPQSRPEGPPPEYEQRAVSPWPADSGASAPEALAAPQAVAPALASAAYTGDRQPTAAEASNSAPQASTLPASASSPGASTSSAPEPARAP